MNLWWTYQQLRSNNLKTRLAAITKLAESKHPDCVEPLLFALKDKDPEIRSAAALALGQFQDKRVAEPLIKLLSDPAPLARATAAEALGQLKEPGATRWLVNLLRDPDATARLRAVQSLERLGWQPKTEAEQKWHFVATGNLNRVAELGVEGIAPLADLMRNGTPEKQLSAIKALGVIEDPRALKLILEALKKPNVMVRLAALEILGRIADPSTYDEVARLLKDKEANVRAAAISTAVICGGDRAVPTLVGMLKDVSWEVRRETVKALGKAGDASAVEGLCAVLQDLDHDVRESAAVALGKIGDPRAIRPLVLALMDVESFVRSAAQSSLKEINSHWEKTAAAHSALPEIKAALKNQEYWISHSATRLLEQISPDTAVKEVEKPVAPVAKIIATPKKPAGLPHAAFALLADLLGDRDRDLRLAAAEAFGQLREKNALTVLTTAVHDQDAFVCQAAERALAALS
jgi:HEAT repeat protein